MGHQQLFCVLFKTLTTDVNTLATLSLIRLQPVQKSSVGLHFEAPKFNFSGSLQDRPLPAAASVGAVPGAGQGQQTPPTPNLRARTRGCSPPGWLDSRLHRRLSLTMCFALVSCPNLILFRTQRLNLSLGGHCRTIKRTME